MNFSQMPLYFFHQSKTSIIPHKATFLLFQQKQAINVMISPCRPFQIITSRQQTECYRWAHTHSSINNAEQMGSSRWTLCGTAQKPNFDEDKNELNHYLFGRSSQNSWCTWWSWTNRQCLLLHMDDVLWTIGRFLWPVILDWVYPAFTYMPLFRNMK